MGENTKIEWCHHTFNSHWGCQRVSPGCENCYAETFAKRTGHDIWGPKAERRFFGDKHWNEPRKWNAAAEKDGERRRVFCASMSDVFEDRSDLDPVRKRLAALITETPALDWLLLTKRPENMPRFGLDMWPFGWPKNVWAGATVEDQRRANERIPLLIRVPAQVRFLSCEPLLEHVDLGLSPDGGIDWVICGGESGGGAREFHIAWARNLLDQCRMAGAAFLMKQLGAVANDGLVRLRTKDRKGGDWDEWPIDIQVREYPAPRPF